MNGAEWDACLDRIRAWAGIPAGNVETAAERERRTALAEGRRIEGSRADWFASITWSQQAWDGLHPLIKHQPAWTVRT